MFCSISWVATGAMLPLIQAELNISTAQAALLTSIMPGAMIFGAPLAGLLLNRFGLKKGYAAGLLLTVPGLFMGLVDNYSLMLLLRFCQGLGCASALCALSPLTQSLFKGKIKDFCLSINISANTLGNVLALLLAGLIAELVSSWKISLSIYPAFNVFLLLLFLFLYKDSSKTSSQNINNKKDFKEAFKSRVTWGMIVFYAGLVVFLHSSFTYMPAYYKLHSNLSDDSLSIHLAPALVSVAMLFAPYFGYYLKRRGVYFKYIFIISPLIVYLGFSLMIFSKIDLLIICAALFAGFAYDLTAAFLYPLPAEIKNANPYKTAYTMSIFWSLIYLFSFISNQIIAFSIDITGGFSFAFIYIFSLAFICIPLSLLILPKREFFKASL